MPQHAGSTKNALARLALAVALAAGLAWRPALAAEPGPRFEAPGTGCSVRMPEHPHLLPTTHDTAAAPDVPHDEERAWYTLDKTTGEGCFLYYVVLHDEVADDQTTKVLKQAFPGFLRQVRMSEAEDIKIDDYPGVQVTGDDDGEYVVGRAYLVHRRLYVLLSVVRKLHEDGSDPYLDSFKLSAEASLAPPVHVRRPWSILMTLLFFISSVVSMVWRKQHAPPVLDADALALQEPPLPLYPLPPPVSPVTFDAPVPGGQAAPPPVWPPPPMGSDGGAVTPPVWPPAPVVSNATVPPPVWPPTPTASAPAMPPVWPPLPGAPGEPPDGGA